MNPTIEQTIDFLKVGRTGPGQRVPILHWTPNQFHGADCLVSGAADAKWTVRLDSESDDENESVNLRVFNEAPFPGVLLWDATFRNAPPETVIRDATQAAIAWCVKSSLHKI